MNLDGAAPRAAELLSEEEAARAACFAYERDRYRWISLHAAMRRILAAELGVNARDITYAYGASGKPSLAWPGDSGLEFNVSDSGDLALMALSRDGPVGIDVEHVGREADIDSIAARFFAAEEVAALGALIAAERVTGFYRCWTRKEAYVKALGAGVWQNLTRFAVSLDAADARFLRRDDAGDEPAWSLYELPLEGPYVGALVVARADATIVLRDWQHNLNEEEPTK